MVEAADSAVEAKEKDRAVALIIAVLALVLALAKGLRLVCRDAARWAAYAPSPVRLTMRP
jgi:hypothetical protein